MAGRRVEVNSGRRRKSSGSGRGKWKGDVGMAKKGGATGKGGGTTEKGLL